MYFHVPDHKIKKNGIILLVWVVLIIFLQLSWHFLPAFRYGYIYGWYPVVARVQRFIAGYIPFSIGDLLYLLAGIGIFLWGIALFSCIFHLRKQYRKLISLLLKAAGNMAGVYFFFMLCWGFNYRADRLEACFRIRVAAYSPADLVSLCRYLLQEVNDAHGKLAAPDDSTAFDIPARELFDGTVHNYAAAAESNPLLQYATRSVKPSMYGYLMNYTGIEGYYNPFTGEAQVNTAMPALLQPFVACHEISHQLGFAQEYAANFVGYFVAAHSDDQRFVYSASLEMFLYAIGKLRFMDSLAAKTIWQELDTGVKKDYEGLRRFYAKFNSPADPLMAGLYDRYLKANDQQKGISSYHQVVALLIDYRRRNGSAARESNYPEVLK